MSPSLAVARPALDVAAMIPPAAAGRQPLFFFGTLMDLDVLTYLLERPVDVADLRPATIQGFRRARAAGASYPVLVPEPGSQVDGRLLRRATADTAQRLLGGLDVGPLVSAVEEGAPVTTGERVSAKDVLAALPDLPVVDEIADRLGANSDGEKAAALELALEALYLAKRIDKVSGEGETVYG